MAGIEMWFKADIEHILESLAFAASDRGSEYHAALIAVGLACGIRPNNEIKLTRTGAARIEVDSPDVPGAVPSDV